MHGGAAGSGAPAGTRNGAYRHGDCTKERLAERAALSAMLREARRVLREVG